MPLNRRRFLGLAAGGAVAGAATWAGLLASRDDDPRRGGDPRSAGGATPKGGLSVPSNGILVVVQMAGGNDALNTLVPASGAYRDARPNLALAEGGLVALDGESRYSLHPALAPLAPYWAAGHLAAMASIGFEGASRSHFEATDAWTAGAPGLPTTTGWLGRWLDATTEGTPDPLRAIAIGGGAASALHTERAPITTIIDPDRFALTAPTGVDAAVLAEAYLASAGPSAGLEGSEGLVAAARAAIPDAFASVRRLSTSGVGSPVSKSETASDDADADADAEDPYAEGDVTTRLDLAARLIAEDLGTRIVVVGANGFDTHAAQADEHKRLLADVALGIDRFQKAISTSGHADRVMVITTSEFGRRIAENGSGGTDHGSAGVQFLIGRGLAEAVVLGDLEAARPDDEGDLRPSIDVRSLYSVALDWLGGPTEDIVDGRYDTYGLLA